MAHAEEGRKTRQEAGQFALERLKQREEILQISYWYQGEGFGAALTPEAVMPFLQSKSSLIATTFDDLVETGDLQRANPGYDFTPQGKRKAARMFVEAFTDFQQPGHGECQDGCCDGDEPCEHHQAHGDSGEARHA